MQLLTPIAWCPFSFRKWCRGCGLQCTSPLQTRGPQPICGRVWREYARVLWKRREGVGGWVEGTSSWYYRPTSLSPPLSLSLSISRSLLSSLRISLPNSRWGHKGTRPVPPSPVLLRNHTPQTPQRQAGINDTLWTQWVKYVLHRQHPLTTLHNQLYLKWQLILLYDHTHFRYDRQQV